MKYPYDIVLLDRDNTINFASKDEASQLYYITEPEHLVLKPGVKEAIELLHALCPKLVLVTKQRCLSKGIITESQLSQIHDELERKLEMKFSEILVEPVNKTKIELYRDIVAENEGARIALFDDSEDERHAAHELGIHAFDGEELLEAVRLAYHIQ
jgi:histidinol phosphatase-like enzyme